MTNYIVRLMLCLFSLVDDRPHLAKIIYFKLPYVDYIHI